MNIDLLNAKEWEELRDNTNVLYSEKDLEKTFLNNIKNSIKRQREDKIIIWDFWKILEVAPFTYAKDFESENEVFEELCIYKALEEYFESNLIKREQQFQYPNFLMWYLTLDNITWHNIVQFQKIMKWKTDDICYKWCLINPKNYINTLGIANQNLILQRANQIWKELKKDIGLAKNVRTEIQGVSWKSNDALNQFDI